jgi:Tfp pilus assembly major pilin PilA
VAAFSVIEVMFSVGVAATVGAVAVPSVAATLDDVRAAGAVRHVAAELSRLKVGAIKQSRELAVRFTPAGSTYEFTIYADGNRNGIRTRDMQSGVDRMLTAARRIGDDFAGVDFGTLPGLPPVDASSAPPGADPIHLGSTDMVVFTPLGTATAGSLYIKGRRGAQYVVRVFGETGKIRILKYDARSQTWKPL